MLECPERGLQEAGADCDDAGVRVTSKSLWLGGPAHGRTWKRRVIKSGPEGRRPGFFGRKLCSDSDRPGFTALPLYNPTPQAPAAAASSDLEAVAAIDPKDCGSGRPAALGTCLWRLGRRRRNGSTGPGTAAGARADDPGP